MKIRKLTIRNVASIESAELDFEHGALATAPLFLICGETGSGKTTLLDCITLALYGKTPRYSGVSVRNACEIGGYAFNDARQLVRHGASSASAKLELIGNDGKPYEAEWSVEAYTRGASKGMLKGEVWSWKDCSEGGLTWVKVKECAAVVLRAVGLEFDQFCRTTLLAQGQFTKFLLGTEDDKAEILEKLTDTSRYSELGKAIAAKYTSLERGVTELEAEIAKMPGLGDKREEVENRIQELANQISEFDAKTKAASTKLQWRQRRSQLEDDLKQVETGLKVAFAELKALGLRNAAEVETAQINFNGLKRYLEEHAGQESMYEQAGVILTGLKDASEARARKRQAEATLARIQADMPQKEQQLVEAQTKFLQAEQAVTASGQVIETEEQTLAAMNLKQVQAEKGEVERRRGNLQELAATIKGIESLKASVDSRSQALVGHREELQRQEATLPALQAAMAAAQTEFAARRKERDHAKSLIAAGVEKLLAELHVGDECPICGNRIERLHGEGHFQALLQPLEDACRRSETEAKNRERQYDAAVASVKGLRSVIASEESMVDGERTKLDQRTTEIAEKARQLGLEDGTMEKVDAAIQGCEERISALAAKLEEIARQSQKLDALRKALKRQVQVKDTAKAKVEEAEQALAKDKHQIERLGDSIKGEEALAANKLSEVSGKVSIPGWLEQWERDPNGVGQAFKLEAEDYMRRKSNLIKAEAELRQLEQRGQQISSCMDRAVGKMPALVEVAPGGKCAESTAVVDGLVGRFEGCGNDCRRHESARPENLEESETVEVLGALVATLKTEGSKLSEERGRCQQQLLDDDQLVLDRQRKREAADRLIAERNEWHPLYTCFGDNDGRKIRREIQSYVLANVLVKSNGYLRQLSERYELSCEGLTLSVIDAFEGGVVRPVNTLSGGEQFLVSLALALGLAGMNDTGLSVDMLLIDEGFGTLSGEHLNAAIEALERLNALTGSQKVGVISHVERLRERIPTHIEVTRTGHDPSQVKVVVNGRQ